MHLRLETTLIDLVEQALQIGVDFFQCFLTLKAAGRIIPLKASDIREFVQLRQKYFTALYMHSSYWVNLSSVKYNPHYLLKKEIAFAKRLEFTHMLFHAGSAKGAKDRIQGIDALARMMNKLIKNEPDLTFVLENVAQGPPCIGGSFSDFRILLEKIDWPEKLFFCIDTGHAYSFGYDIANINNQDGFIDMIDNAVSLERVALIHLNNTIEPLGSKVDMHQPLDSGNISLEALKHFILHPRLCHIPVLIEPVVMPEAELKKEFDMVVGWQKNPPA